MARVNQETPPPEPEQAVAVDDLKLYTVKQVSDIFQVTEYTVRSWLKAEGGLRGTKMGRGTTGHWRISGKELVRFANDKFGN